MKAAIASPIVFYLKRKAREHFLWSKKAVMWLLVFSTVTYSKLFYFRSLKLFSCSSLHRRIDRYHLAIHQIRCSTSMPSFASPLFSAYKTFAQSRGLVERLLLLAEAGLWQFGLRAGIKSSAIFLCGTARLAPVHPETPGPADEHPLVDTLPPSLISQAWTVRAERFR